LTYSPYSPWATYTPYGILTVLANGNVHAIFGVLNVLAFGNIHDFGDVHAVFGGVHAFFGVLTVLDLGIFVLLILALRGTVAVTSCEQQHEFLIVAWESV